MSGAHAGPAGCAFLARPLQYPSGGPLGLLVFLLAFLASGCGPEENGQAPPASGGVPLQALEGMILRESQAGRLRWVLRADSAFHYGDEEKTLLLGVHVDFYNDRGDSVRSRLTAREGEIDPKSRNLVARDSVVVSTQDGIVLETEELWWDHALGKVVSDRFVRLTRGESVVTGIGIESDVSLRSYVIRKHVEAQLREGNAELEEFQP